MTRYEDRTSSRPTPFSSKVPMEVSKCPCNYSQFVSKNPKKNQESKLVLPVKTFAQWECFLAMSFQTSVQSGGFLSVTKL